MVQWTIRRTSRITQNPRPKKFANFPKTQWKPFPMIDRSVDLSVWPVTEKSPTKLEWNYKFRIHLPGDVSFSHFAQTTYPVENRFDLRRWHIARSIPPSVRNPSNEKTCIVTSLLKSADSLEPIHEPKWMSQQRETPEGAAWYREEELSNNGTISVSPWCRKWMSGS